MFQAWARLGKCLGKEFKPYMSVSIPRLLRSAKIGSYVLIPENPDNVDESDGRLAFKMKIFLHSSNAYVISKFLFLFLIFYTCRNNATMT